MILVLMHMIVITKLFAYLVVVHARGVYWCIWFAKLLCKYSFVDYSRL